ncbi:MAG: type VI secretion system accessory protein TagJ, partial [Nitrospinota bacterium]
GFIPSRYPGSHENDDPLICLSRKTEWAKKTETLFIGEGQRVLNTDTAEYPLLEARTIDFTA